MSWWKWYFFTYIIFDQQNLTTNVLKQSILNLKKNTLQAFPIPLNWIFFIPMTLNVFSVKNVSRIQKNVDYIRNKSNTVLWLDNNRKFIRTSSDLSDMISRTSTGFLLNRIFTHLNRHCNKGTRYKMSAPMYHWIFWPLWMVSSYYCKLTVSFHCFLPSKKN